MKRAKVLAPLLAMVLLSTAAHADGGGGGGSLDLVSAIGLAVVAANAPRRYANRVTRLGREALLDLSSQAQAALPPLPYGLPSAQYREQFQMAMVEAMQEMRDRCPVPPAMERAANTDSAH